jgi:DNA repair exonuclease SbcCD ATPase subunit
MMSRIEFVSMTVEGFGSLRDETNVFLQDGGVVILRGENGVGKTTLFNALVWCLYGKNLKGVTNSQVATWEWLRSENWRGTRVIVSFIKDNVRYSVTRHIKWKGDTYGYKGENKLYVFKNGEELIDARDNSDHQQIVIDLLGVDYSLFVNSVVFGQRMKRLVESSGSEIREVLSNLFEVHFIDAAKEESRRLMHEAEEKVGDLDRKVESKTLQIARLEDKLNQDEAHRRRFYEDKEAEISSLERRLEENARNLAELKKVAEIEDMAHPGVNLEDALAHLKEKQDTWQEHDRYVTELKRSKSKYQLEIKRMQDEVAAQKPIGEYCPVCEQALPKDKVSKLVKERNEANKEVGDVIKVMEGKIEDIEVNIEKARELAEGSKKKLDDYQKFVDLLKADWKAYNDNREGREKRLKSIQSYETTIAMLNGRLTEVKESEYKPAIDAEEVKAEQKALNAEIEALTKDKQQYEEEVHRHAWWYKTGFSAKGLRAYILRTMLQEINLKVNKYASMLGIGISFGVDFSVASLPFEVKVNLNGHEVNYADLSGGQAQRVNVAMSFGIHDVVSAGTDCNLLILDEVFEGLDAGGLETIFAMIRNKVAGRTVYVITHRESLDALSAKFIDVETRNGITKIRG